MQDRDFTISTYKQLLQEFKKSNYQFFTLEEYISLPNHPFTSSPSLPFVILRHDVDRKPQNSLRMAKLENELGIKASYYFRIGKKSNQPEIIKQIAELGHEIGYHYEDLTYANGDYNKAIKQFEKNLNYFRKFYPVKTMCMHGSPLSKWDNRDLWNKYDYKEYGIIAEPYFDLNFNEIFYITDASRSWNNEKVTLRDKVKSNFNIKINSGFDIITLLNKNKLPNKILLNIHPHNWTDNKAEWYKILLWQSLKNSIKSYLKK